MRAPRLAALIGSPVATEAPVLRPALAPALPSGRVEPVGAGLAMPAAQQPRALPPKPAPVAVQPKKAIPQAGEPVDPPPRRRKSPKPAVATPDLPHAPDVKPAPQSKDASVPSQLSEASTISPEPAIGPLARIAPTPAPNPVARSPDSGPAQVVLRDPVRSAAALEPAPDVAPHRRRYQPRPVAQPLLPADPERLAASAARLGLGPAKPLPPPDLAPERVARSLRQIPPRTTPASRADDHAPATRPVAPLPKPEAAVAPKPTAAVRHVQPELAPDPLVLRPAERRDEPLPAAPPSAEPRVRVEIGRVTLIAPEARSPGSAMTARKSTLAPVVRRAGRGHSIPRPGGL